MTRKIPRKIKNIHELSITKDFEEAIEKLKQFLIKDVKNKITLER
jgi:hypothetical protein